MNAKRQQKERQREIDEWKRAPGESFDAPATVARHPHLAREDKIAILRAWEREERALAVAADENMAGDRPPRLREVLDALLSLDASPEGEDPSAFGG